MVTAYLIKECEYSTLWTGKSLTRLFVCLFVCLFVYCGYCVRSTFRLQYQTCEKTALTTCLKGFDEPEELEKKIKKSQARRRNFEERRLCNWGVMESPPSQPGQCAKKYKRVAQVQCGANMFKTYGASRADPSLCRSVLVRF